MGAAVFTINAARSSYRVQGLVFEAQGMEKVIYHAMARKSEVNAASWGLTQLTLDTNHIQLHTDSPQLIVGSRLAVWTLEKCNLILKSFAIPFLPQETSDSSSPLPLFCSIFLAKGSPKTQRRRYL
jgi:hypothetical protein